MSRPLQIAVVGAGTAGLAAAVFLARQGHALTVFERAPAPSAVGAGITLQPTGQWVLVQLGLLQAIEAQATRVDGLLVRRIDGKPIVDLRYADVSPSLYGLGLHRGVLFAALWDAAKQACTIHTNVEVSQLPLSGSGRNVIAQSGQYGSFDLIIVADGANSKLQPFAAPTRATTYPWGALWHVAPDPGGTLTNDARVVQGVDGARNFLGLLPTGRAPNGDAALVSLFWSIRADAVAAWRERGLGVWKDAARRLLPQCEPILHGITDTNQLFFTSYRDVTMQRWHGERIVVLGDAAHATSPQLGQGANLALLDAHALSEALARWPLEEALPAYTRNRRHHVAYYQFATRALTPFFQSDSRVAGIVRDALMPMSRWLPPLRRRMVRTMCGFDRGIVRSPMQLPLGQLSAISASHRDAG